MNDIEQLNERIAQLTDLVASANDTIKNAEEMIKLVEQERDRLAAQQREQEPKFERVKSRENYSCIIINSCGASVVGDKDFDTDADLRYFKNNNYFHTCGRAQEVADKINFLLKLERLHDTFCPDYVPDRGNDMIKYIVGFDAYNKRWYIGQTFVNKDASGVYFPTKEIAQKVCDILNFHENLCLLILF